MPFSRRHGEGMFLKLLVFLFTLQCWGAFVFRGAIKWAPAKVVYNDGKLREVTVTKTSTSGLLPASKPFSLLGPGAASVQTAKKLIAIKWCGY